MVGLPIVCRGMVARVAILTCVDPQKVVCESHLLLAYIIVPRTQSGLCFVVMLLCVP